MSPEFALHLREVLPIVGGADRKFLTDLMTRCGVILRDRVGSSDRLFRLASGSHDESILHQRMKSLSDRDLSQFLDHVVPFLRNIYRFRRAKGKDRYWRCLMRFGIGRLTNRLHRLIEN